MGAGPFDRLRTGRFAALGIEPLKTSPAKPAAWVRSEHATYGKIVKEVGIASQ